MRRERKRGIKRQKETESGRKKPRDGVLSCLYTLYVV